MVQTIHATPLRALLAAEPTIEMETKKSRSECAKMLLDKSAGYQSYRDPENGDSYLHFAARLALVELARYLLTTGKMSATLKNKQSQTPLYSAADGITQYIGIELQRRVSKVQTEVPKLGQNEMSWREITNLFVQLGCDINDKDSKGYTPLHLACWRFSFCTFRCGFTLNPEDYMDIFEETVAYDLLRKIGAKEDDKEKNGWTPLELISRQVGLKAAHDIAGVK